MRPEPHLPRRPHCSIVDRPFCKRTVDSARERLASLGCVSLECGLRGFVRLRRMLLSLALGLGPPLPRAICTPFSKSGCGEMFSTDRSSGCGDDLTNAKYGVVRTTQRHISTASKSRLRSGMKHLGAGLRRRLSLLTHRHMLL